MERSELEKWDAAQWEAEFDLLLEEADKVLAAEPGADQAIAVKTAKGNIYSMADRNALSGDFSDEEAFIQMLTGQGDTEILLLLCKLNGYSVHPTSWYFNKRLVELDPGNENAEILLQGVDAYHVKKLKVIMPSKK